jgi:hypothetical protein
MVQKPRVYVNTRHAEASLDISRYGLKSCSSKKPGELGGLPFDTSQAKHFQPGLV